MYSNPFDQQHRPEHADQRAVRERVQQARRTAREAMQQRREQLRADLERRMREPGAHPSEA